jgi:hypothetical protein
MKCNALLAAFATLFGFTILANPASAQLLITEVSSDNILGADWFELTNTGDTTVSINNWYWDDNGPTGADGSLFLDLSIAAGESVIVIRDSESLDMIATTFRGIYGLDASVRIFTEDDIAPIPASGDLFSGLSSNGDEISLWDGDPNPSAGTAVNLIDFVEFPAAPNPEFEPADFGKSFDFSSGTAVLSTVGVDGAVLATNGDVASPGFTPLVPPASLPGDFEPDGDVDADDIDFYSGNIGAMADGDLAQLDFDNDGVVTLDDHQFHIENFVQTPNGAGTFVGDINLDGSVNVLGDAFSLVGNLGLSSGAGYADGDLNADGAVNVLGDAFGLVGNLGRSNGE